MTADFSSTSESVTWVVQLFSHLDVALPPYRRLGVRRVEHRCAATRSVLTGPLCRAIDR